MPSFARRFGFLPAGLFAVSFAHCSSGASTSDAGTTSTKDAGVNFARDALVSDARDARAAMTYTCADTSSSEGPVTDVSCVDAAAGPSCTGTAPYNGCSYASITTCYCGVTSWSSGATGWVCVGHSCGTGTGTGAGLDAGSASGSGSGSGS